MYAQPVNDACKPIGVEQNRTDYVRCLISQPEPLARQPGSCYWPGVWRRLGSHWESPCLWGASDTSSTEPIHRCVYAMLGAEK